MFKNILDRTAIADRIARAADLQRMAIARRAVVVRARARVLPRSIAANDGAPEAA